MSSCCCSSKAFGTPTDCAGSRRSLGAVNQRHPSPPDARCLGRSNTGREKTLHGSTCHPPRCAMPLRPRSSAERQLQSWRNLQSAPRRVRHNMTWITRWLTYSSVGRPSGSLQGITCSVNCNSGPGKPCDHSKYVITSMPTAPPQGGRRWSTRSLRYPGGAASKRACGGS